MRPSADSGRGLRPRPRSSRCPSVPPPRLLGGLRGAPERLVPEGAERALRGPDGANRWHLGVRASGRALDLPRILGLVHHQAASQRDVGGLVHRIEPRQRRGPRAVQAGRQHACHIILVAARVDVAPSKPFSGSPHQWRLPPELRRRRRRLDDRVERHLARQATALPAALLRRGLARLAARVAVRGADLVRRVREVALPP
mmetsp:Transcript_14463/g.38350  ORF Transcript_14463/g.38350 Transcript_14463/m.38350 type:complete len:200 (-) Transcript_14463:477-1076(-)